MYFLEDVRFGLRMLAKSPGFTLVAVVALALGIGVNAAVFTLSNALLFKGFPFDDGDRIAYLGSRNLGRPQDRFGPASFPDFRDWRTLTKSFDGMAAASGLRISLSDQSGLPESYPGVQVSANAFQLIGQKPAIGRDFRATDEAAGAAPVAMLTYGLWERRYGKDGSVVGRTVRINGAATEVIGVMPKGFSFPFNTDLWMALTPGANSEKREIRNLIAFGRLAKGVTLKAARTEMRAIDSNLTKAYPVTNQNFTSVVFNYNEFYIGPMVTTVFSAMLGAVGFVLLIACANVANLLLSRAATRSREVSIRMALGAGRWRIIRQLLVESVILSATGGFLGWLIAIWGVRVFDLQTAQYGKPVWIDFSMDYRAFLYLGTISIGTGLLFGLAPALRLSKVDITSGLKDGGRGSSAGVLGKRLSSLLVVAEVALAVVLLVATGLMVRSFLNIYQAKLGVNQENMLTMRLALPANKYPKPDDQISFHQRLNERLQAIGGVDTVSIASTLPTGGSATFPYEIFGAPAVDMQRRPTLSAVVVNPNYFRAVGVAVLAGRDLTETDGISGPPVILVNQRFAVRSWPGEDPLGKRLRLFTGNTPEPWLTVVGLVPNIVQNDITPKEIDPLIYMPYRYKPQADMAIVARTRVPPSSLGTAFRREIQKLDSDLPIYNMWTLKERIERNYWFYRIIGILFLIFAAIALLLASIGLYAVMANSVNQRVQEFGIRMAMGAGGRDVLQIVLSRGLLYLAVGLAVGLAGAFAVTRVLRAALVAVSPVDPVTFVAVLLVLTAAAVMGCLIPALRATRINPVVALRHE